MTYINVAGLVRWPNLLAGAFLCAAVTACGSSSDGGGGGSGGSGPVGPTGCLVQQFSGEPDIILFPDIAALTLSPGSSVEFTMFVDDETRQVQATLMDAWRLRDRPQGQSETVIRATTGGSLDFSIPITTTGRYYVDVVLCSGDCTDSRVVYTLNRANAGPGSDAINDPYERIAYEGDQEVRSTFSCRHPDSIAIQ
jgi:hypothetical protein